MEPQVIRHDRKKCIVPGCPSSRQVKHHVFPKDEKQGKLWLDVVSSPILSELTYEEIHDKGYRVCTRHFREEDFLSGPRNFFRKKPIPSLFLPPKVVNNVSAEVAEEMSIDLDDTKIDSSSLLCDTMNFSKQEFTSSSDNDSPRSSTSVKKSSEKIRLDVGITKTMRNLLKNVTDQMTDDEEKACVLIWGEIPLQMHLFYCLERDKVVGFEDWGINRTNKYADRALIFMLRGIESDWKIPLAYNFFSEETTHKELLWCIKEVVKAVTEAGFNIVASVCDQGSSNMKAIKTLQTETDKVREEKGITKYWTILIDGVEFIPLFDPLDILKSVRNNLLTNDLEFDMQGHGPEKRSKIGTWDHITKLYTIDMGSSKLNQLTKLTEQHIYQEKMDKTCVKLMMQVFSHRVASLMHLLVRSTRPWKTTIGEETVEINVPAEASQTAELLDLLNDTADAINGDDRDDKNFRRIPWTKESYHNSFFEEVRTRFGKMQFVDHKTKKQVPTDVPCLENLINTLGGFQLVWKKLQKLGFVIFCTRDLSQEPLDDVFDAIKSHNFPLNKPTCSQFEKIFKSLVIKNLTSEHMSELSCEEDDSEFILPHMDFLATGKFEDDEVSMEELDLDESENKEWLSETNTDLRKAHN